MSDKKSGPMTLVEACKIIGWFDEDSMEPSRSDVERLNRRLVAAEKRNGARYVHGSSRGTPRTTTHDAMVAAGLISERVEGMRLVTEAFAASNARFDELEGRLKTVVS